ncbi:urease accessory protein UreD [Rhodobacter sp. Har01]|uniref:urease accessory protein UreD n=1 Tax=Rhodobacter sp. Har01 TaxID=2883999 RepID=UPI001D080C24|nr:urease accessory protein UreD [Rhodobacter sp. Har01]MCB6177845.1 urease accessory protein UreD [Rhodobacter sp. Har01]
MIHHPVLALERSRGVARVEFALRDGRAALADLAQSSSAKVLLPQGAGAPEAVFLNTSGGLTSGDRLGYAVDLGAGVTATATTQTAERAYLARDGAARVELTASVGAGGRLCWLPQETILFEGSHLDRETVVDLALGASVVLTESVVLGRRAMGEAPQRARLSDRRRVTLAGRPLWAEAQRLDEGILAAAGRPAGLGPNVAFAVVAFCGAGAEAAVPGLREVAVPDGVQAAVTGWNGRCLARAMARDGWPLKLWLGRVVARLTGAPLPRTWAMQGMTA